ncbi:helix-turn-helix domain-containing protein [Amycolatopsis jiangsuensis]|uniref:Transcriptional regulator with XRE-family HTH domain n=1 Tax=Amycolatopsis jiangsuensis TaxID=1181879 RepID=A0A840IRC4_9PSEU|nr:XRE family transcriptional regulator [Amycolatopsis jiangsuensis]MBB4683782.1 transcriptional regulator with XRE-family HTH domain [Amycolatopsis jiangsuensis]
MTQESDLEGTVRMRIRSLRQARGWSLDNLAERAVMSPSSLSRIETGRQRLGLDQLTALARALGTSIDQLAETINDDDVVIRPERDEHRGLTTWLLSRGSAPAGVTVAKMRITDEAAGPQAVQLGVHPGKEWFTVLSGTVALFLGERTVRVEAGEAAEFSTMTPHAIRAHGGPAEILVILDHDGRRTHLHPPESGRSSAD